MQQNGAIGRRFRMMFEDGEIPDGTWHTQAARWLAGVQSRDASIDVLYDDNSINLQVNPIGLASALSGMPMLASTIAQSPHSFRVWTVPVFDSSGNVTGYQWHCNKVNTPSSGAGSVYNESYVRYDVAGTALADITGAISVYCNVTQTSDTVMSGAISTDPIAVSVSEYPKTFPVKLADIEWLTDSASGENYPRVITRWVNDIYAKNSSGGGSSTPATPHPFMISVSEVGPLNYKWSCTAGGVYQWSGSFVTVAAVAATVATTSVSIYLNMQYSAGTLTVTVSTTPYADNLLYGFATARWSVKIAEISYNPTTSSATILQTLHDYYDIRGRIIPAALSGYNAFAVQTLYHDANGSAPAWATIAGNCVVST